MTIYKDLNDVKLDLSEFEERPLSKHEQKRILKQFKRKISLKTYRKKWLGASLAVIAVCMLGFSLTLGKGTIANMPFTGETIEKYINENKNLDYSSYKTIIGESAENELGKLTLNEVMIDHDQVYFSATFEPAEHVPFDYQTQIIPEVRINGEDSGVRTGAQSIELNSRMFTIYNDIELSQAIETEDVKIEINYNTLTKAPDRTMIEHPWTFDVNVSQAQLLKEKKVFELDKLITLNNGDAVTIQRVVTSPISTTVYYDLSDSQSEEIYFSIQSEDGQVGTFSSAFTSNDTGDVSVIRFNGLQLGDQPYYLLPHDFEDQPLTEIAIPIQ